MERSAYAGRSNQALAGSPLNSANISGAAMVDPVSAGLRALEAAPARPDAIH